MRPSRTGLTAHALALGGESRRLDTVDANVEEAAPVCDICEQLPDDADRRLDDLRRAS
jgi:hypothetical protein